MRQLFVTALIATFFANAVLAQAPKLIANKYTRYGVYALTPHGQMYLPDIPDFNLLSSVCHVDPIDAYHSSATYGAHTWGESSYLPYQIRVEANAAVARRGSCSAQLYYYLHVDTPTIVEVKAVASIIRYVWVDQTLVNLYDGSWNLQAQFTSDDGTQTGSSLVTLVPGTTYRFCVGVNRNNYMQGPEVWDTDSVTGTLTVLGSRVGGVGDPAFVGDWSTKKLTIQVWQGTTLVETLNDIPMMPGGRFAFAPTTRGTVDLKVRGDSWLYKTVPGVVLTDDVTMLPAIQLTNGDVDGSGEVDAADIDRVIANFGFVGVSNSDVDGSTEVDAADIDIVIANFGATDN